MADMQDVCHIACFSQVEQPTIFQYALLQVKDKLLEDITLVWETYKDFYSKKQLNTHYNVYICYTPRWFFNIGILKEWKNNRSLISNMSPKYVAEADLSDLVDPKRPVLKLCTMTPEGNLQIPESERKKWLNDPVRSGLSWCKFLMFEKLVATRYNTPKKFQLQ